MLRDLLVSGIAAYTPAIVLSLRDTNDVNVEDVKMLLRSERQILERPKTRNSLSVRIILPGPSIPSVSTSTDEKSVALNSPVGPLTSCTPRSEPTYIWPVMAKSP